MRDAIKLLPTQRQGRQRATEVGVEAGLRPVVPVVWRTAAVGGIGCAVGHDADATGRRRRALQRNYLSSGDGA